MIIIDNVMFYGSGPIRSSHLIQLRDIVCGENALVKEAYYGTLKVL